MLKYGIYLCFYFLTGVEIGSMIAKKNWSGLAQRITLLLVLALYLPL